MIYRFYDMSKYSGYGYDEFMKSNNTAMFDYVVTKR
jgi:hypothetical protein